MFPPLVIPSASPYPDNMQSSLTFDGANGSTSFVDLIDSVSWTPAGNAQVQDGMLRTDGSGDWISRANKAGFAIGTKAFQIAFRVKFGSSLPSVIGDLVNQWGATGSIRFALGWLPASGGVLRWYFSQDGSSFGFLDFPWAPAPNTTYDVDLTRSGNTLTARVNGSTIGSPQVHTASIWSGGSAVLGVGGFPAGPRSFDGWMDNFSFSVG